MKKLPKKTSFPPKTKQLSTLEKPSSSGVSLKFDTPEIRIGLNAVRPYETPKESTASKKLKSTEKSIKMPGKPDRNPARKPIQKSYKK